MSVNRTMMLRRNFSSSAAAAAWGPTEPNIWLTVVFFLSVVVKKGPPRSKGFSGGKNEANLTVFSDLRASHFRVSHQKVT